MYDDASIDKKENCDDWGAKWDVENRAWPTLTNSNSCL